MVKQQEHPTIFLQKIGKIEFVLFIFSFAGLVLNTLHIKGGKLVMGLGLNAFALLYIFVAIGFRQLQTKNRFDRAVFTFSYLALSVLIIGIMFGILGVRGINLLTNGGMLLVLFLIFVIQIRRIRMGSISNNTTSLLYRLVIFWMIALMAHYIIPGRFHETCPQTIFAIWKNTYLKMATTCLCWVWARGNPGQAKCTRQYELPSM
jgi:hypothetical protein